MSRRQYAAQPHHVAAARKATNAQLAAILRGELAGELPKAQARGLEAAATDEAQRRGHPLPLLWAMTYGL